MVTKSCDSTIVFLNVLFIIIFFAYSAISDYNKNLFTHKLVLNLYDAIFFKCLLVLFYASIS